MVEHHHVQDALDTPRKDTMIAKEQLTDALIRECDICTHLYTKLPTNALGYRPTPGQRSTLDLLRYLAICGVSSLTCLRDANWKLFGEFSARTDTMAAEEFPDAMARQKAEIQAFFQEVDEDTLRTQTAPMPGGGTLPLGAAIMHGPVKWMAAYKLQLFLYAKAAGASEIGTANAWAGIDWKGPT